VRRRGRPSGWGSVAPSRYSSGNLPPLRASPGARGTPKGVPFPARTAFRDIGRRCGFRGRECTARPSRRRSRSTRSSSTRSESRGAAKAQRRRTGRPAPAPGGHRSAQSVPPTPLVPGSLPPGAAVSAPELARPHGHIICRACGRIADLALTALDLHFLDELSQRRPPGWSSDGITYSITGGCPRCRQGGG
jgi:hypothetical protein